MKKIIVVFILLLILAAVAFPAASSKEYVRAADSATVSEQVKSQLKVDESDTVIRVYCMSIKEAFTKFDTVDQALLSDSLSSVYYAIMDAEGRINYYENRGGRYIPVKADGISIPIDFYLEGNIQIWNQIGSDAIIYYRYFINDGTDSAVYYKTSQGEFVYYSTSKIGQNLFPLKDFISYQNAPYPLPGSREYQALRFKFRDFYANPISENPWFFLSAGALLLIAGICAAAVILYRKKYMLHIPSPQSQEAPFDPDLIINHCLNSTACAKQ